MVPLLFKEIKGVSFSCASSSSVAICDSIDRGKPIARPITGRRTINGHAPHLKDPPRTKSHNQKFIRESSEKSTNVVSSGNSSRYLLSSSRLLSIDTSFDTFPVPEPVPPPVKSECSKPQRITSDEPSIVPRPSSSARPQDQVVVLRVSLHCKGCEGKVRKHISKMEGVTSFSIDLATKKVTVIGDVTPLGVLRSISKVKNAQFWPLLPPQSSSTLSS